MTNFYFTCGISGVGKSKWVHDNAFNTDIILDSDNIREELYQDPSIQGDPNKVFSLMFRRAVEALRANKNVYYCATGINAKHRIHLLTQLKKAFPDTLYKCIICIAPIEICKERNFARDRVVPEYVIDRQIRSFQIPMEAEGWDSIEVVETYPIDHEVLRQKIWQEVKDFGSQKNSHHQLSLFNHCLLCGLEAHKFWPDNEDLDIAATWHDCGKLYTQTYWPDRDDEAHYPSHAELGSYLMLCMGFSLYSAQLVSAHMYPYNTQAQDAWRARCGESLWDDVLKLHACDVSSH